MWCSWAARPCVSSTQRQAAAAHAVSTVTSVTIYCPEGSTCVWRRKVGAHRGGAVDEMGSSPSGKWAQGWIRKPCSLAGLQPWKNKAGLIETERIRKQKYKKGGTPLRAN